MRILGIESSCDDTSVALLEVKDGQLTILAEKTASQIDVHKKYGGVVPEIAGRKHAEAMVPLVEEVLAQGAINKEQGTSMVRPDAIAVTAGPGLITGLLVGVETAKTLSYLWNVPVVPVNHIEGHIYSVLLGESNEQIHAHATPPQSSLTRGGSDLRFPVLCLIVSGGHTELILMKDHGVYEKIGGTRDDAAGECFDKVAKLLGLEYPGGPKISKLALEGDTTAISLPRPMMTSDNYDFSFAGLKTAALYWLRDNPVENEQTKADFCASFEQAIVDVLVTKTLRAVKEYQPKTVILSGGVSANRRLRETLQSEIKIHSIHSPLSTFYFPLPTYCMDNAAMIATAGYFHAVKKEFVPWQDVKAEPNWKIYGVPQSNM